jgi:23S rRNA pseudouridine1911/1915/1917 synthase
MLPPDLFIVPAELDGWRLDRVLTALRPDASRTRWQNAIRHGLVTLNDRIVTSPGVSLARGDRVRATLPEADMPERLRFEEPESPIHVRFHDSDLMVVAKPRGVVVHPSAGHWHNTLVQALWPVLEEAGGEPFRPGIVHRLDKDTSGLLIVARTADARQRLSDMLARREIHRSYWALVEGALEPPTGRIDAPVGRHPGDRLKMAVVLNGRSAATRYRTLAWWERFSWLELELETGRTHQIRVHLAHLGHPVAGDPLYGHAGLLDLPGQALHAWRIAFRHPMTGAEVVVEEPWPADWRPLLDQLGRPWRGELPRRPVARNPETAPS